MSAGRTGARRSRIRRDRGDVMLWVVVSTPFLLVGIAALTSASQHWEMRREVQAIAAAAARAGAQADGELLRVPVDRRTPSMLAAADRRAEQRARAVVAADDRAVDADAKVVTVEIVDDELTVEVVARIRYVLAVPGMPMMVRGRASAVSIEAVRAEDRPGSTDGWGLGDEVAPAR